MTHRAVPRRRPNPTTAEVCRILDDAGLAIVRALRLLQQLRTERPVQVAACMARRRR